MATERHSTNRQTLNRRELLKALGAIGGAAAASVLLPEQWAKPVVEAGVGPAHAQSSVCGLSLTFDQCTDNGAFWVMQPSLTLGIDSLALIIPRCIGVSLRFSFILDNNAGQTIYSSHPEVYLTNSQGFAEPIIYLPVSQFSGIPHAVKTHWEFADPKYGQMECDWTFGVPPLP
jgi:hypothetical protein